MEYFESKFNNQVRGNRSDHKLGLGYQINDNVERFKYLGSEGGGITEDSEQNWMQPDEVKLPEYCVIRTSTVKGKFYKLIQDQNLSVGR